MCEKDWGGKAFPHLVCLLFFTVKYSFFHAVVWKIILSFFLHRLWLKTIGSRMGKPESQALTFVFAADLQSTDASEGKEPRKSCWVGNLIHINTVR